ncbi:MAG: MFS transporter [Rickettsiales bacterium]|nr:MFS transporter [Rickettsiales bacterium]RPG15065.1 MAG: efflux RND transporter permease subunit [Pelagibacteraceae bacterium TMED195]|tara:strand:- start:2461 stop:5556 length:3096 start_codon:yes stop_codon:yes gene_type:complete
MLNKFLKSSKLILTILFFFVIYGLYQYNTLPKESDPDISLPVIYISLTHKGISPKDSERLLVKPIEKELKNIEGLKKITSTSYQGGGNVVLEFDAGFDSVKAMSDTREKVDLIKNKLPNDSEEPRIFEVNLSRFPVLAIGISGDVENRSLNNIAKRLKEDIETISEVLEVKALGENERIIEIIVNPRIVETYGLTNKDVVSSIAKSNFMVAAGTLSNEKGSFNVQVPSLIENRKDLLNIPIKSNSNSVITLGDVAEVRDTFREKVGYARNNGESAIILEISKRTGENIIDVIEKIKKLVLQKNYIPDFVRIDFFQDESEKIVSMVNDLENNVILATLIVFLVIYSFMGKKSSILVSLSIPFSFLMSMIILSFFNVTINVVVLFALILSVGILIDGAIIVVEYANRRSSEGLSKKEVFILSAKQMSIPVIASTSTTLAAFFPLIFWPGIAGEFMFFLPVTLLAVLTSSLTMALIFIPVVGQIIGNDKELSQEKIKNLNLLEKGDLSKIKGIQGRYLNFMDYTLENPKKLIFLTITILIFIQTVYLKLGKGFEFFPPIEPDYAEIVIHARGNFSALEKDDIVKKIEKEVLKNQYIKNIYSRSGIVKGDTRNESEDVIGSIKIELTNWKQRPQSRYVIDELKHSTKKFPGIYIEFIEKQDGPPKDKDVEIEIVNNNSQKLTNDTSTIYTFLKKKNWVKNIDTDLNIPGVEWELSIDRVKAEKQGVDIEMISNSIQMLTHGLKVTDFMPGDSNEEVDIVIRFEKAFRTLDELDKIFIEGKNGSVSLSSFIKRSAKKKIGNISRYNLQRSKNIKFDVIEGELPSNKIYELRQWLVKQKLSSKVIFTGQEEDQIEAKIFLTKAFFIAIFLITIILIATFNSFYFCFIILSAIIFSTIGVMIGLLLSGKPFGIIMSGIGVIALAGIVVNNNIVLLDTYKELRKKGENIKNAILRTGAQRLRPVLLTTLTTFFGLIPMAIGLNINFIELELNFNSPSSQWWLQLSNAIVFGVMFSFVLTLVITPCLIMIGETSKFFKSF